MCNKYNQSKSKGYQFESGEHGCASRQDYWEEPEEQNGNDTVLFQLRIFRKQSEDRKGGKEVDAHDNELNTEDPFGPHWY